MAPPTGEQPERFMDTLNDSLKISKRLVLSYIVDWIFILFTAAMGRIFQTIEPNRHAFALGDVTISYPYAEKESVSVKVLAMASVFVPAVFILLASLIFIPGRTADSHAPKGLAWRRKLWEWNAGWMGLGVALATTFAATEGLKVIYGKPRPDLLSRCNPDLSAVEAHAVGALGNALGNPATTLVDWNICRDTSEKLTRHGFVAFPSGHSSTSFAGLSYLSLWLCAKFSVAFPSLWSTPSRPDPRQSAFLSDPGLASSGDGLSSSPSGIRRDAIVPMRNQDAAPPTYLVLIAFVPTAAAAYIASSRWTDNRHRGWDILAGSLLGLLFAYVGFRLYHLPLGSNGGGWAWGPRTRDRAFLAGVGMPGYVGGEGTSTAREAITHPEDGSHAFTRQTNTSGSQFGSRASIPRTGTGGSVPEDGSWERETARQ